MTVPNSLKTVKAKLKALPKVSLHNSKPTHVWWLKKPNPQAVKKITKGYLKIVRLHLHKANSFQKVYYQPI